MHRLLALACCAVLAGLASVPAAETPAPTSTWLHWRGPTEQGYVTDDRVPLEWSETKNVLWKTKLPGLGHSTPIVFGDRMFLTGSASGGSERYLFCVKVSDGSILWKETVAKEQPLEKTHAWNGYASSSCATDGKYVYAFFGTPGLFCYDIDGKFVWKKEFGSFASMGGWGTAASPYLYEDLVILSCDNDGGVKGAAPAALVALDKKTGEPRWSTPRNQGRAFSTPRLIKMKEGRTDLVLNGPDGVWGYDPKSGKERWRCTRAHDKEQNKFGEPLPVDDGKRMFILSGRTGPYQLLEMPGEGDVTKTNMIHTQDRGRRDVCSPILVKDRVYCVDKSSKLSVFDFTTGKELSTQELKRGVDAMSSPIYVRGKLVWILAEGTGIVAEPGDKPKVVGRNKLDGGKLDYGASPVVIDGRMYIRSASHLYCIGEKN